MRKPGTQRETSGLVVKQRRAGAPSVEWMLREAGLDESRVTGLPSQDDLPIPTMLLGASEGTSAPLDGVGIARRALEALDLVVDRDVVIVKSPPKAATGAARKKRPDKHLRRLAGMQ